MPQRLLRIQHISAAVSLMAVAKIIMVMGARPNFMKVAPLLRYFKKHQNLSSYFDLKTVHTGQHAADVMSGVFLRQLGIGQVDFNLNVGGGTQAEVTGKVMQAFEQICDREKPDAVLVVGDVNSTLAAAITAKKSGAQVIHVEAGLRSRNLRMPEEVNRLAIDAVADLFFTTTEADANKLLAEGKPASAVFFAGNVMIDSLLYHQQQIPHVSCFSVGEHKLDIGNFCALTLHRPVNVDDPQQLAKIMRAINEVSRQLPVLFPCHPRTRKNLAGVMTQASMASGAIIVCEPLDYFSMLQLYSHAKFFITDSGGVQEETTVLGVPCLTLRAETERPITVVEGSNTLIGDDMERLREEVHRILSGTYKRGNCPKLWDGQAAERIWEVISRRFQARHEPHISLGEVA